MKNKLTTYLLILTLSASACGPRVKGENNVDKNQQRARLTGWEMFQSLIKAENPNIPLAESLTKLLQEQDPEFVIQLRKKMETGEFIIDSKTSDQWTEAKKSLLVDDSSAIADEDMLLNSLNLNLREVERSNAFNHQIDIKAAGIVQSLALKNILHVYDEQIKKDSTELSAEIVRQLQLDNPELLNKIDKTKAMSDRSAQVEQIIIYLKRADYLFKKYEVSDTNTSKLVLYTAVAGTMASVLAKQSSVRHLLQVVIEVKDLVIKVKRIVGLTLSIKKFSDDLNSNAKVMVTSIEGIYENIIELNDSADLDLTLTKEAKKNAKLILNDILNGQSPAEIPTEVSEELKKSGFFEKSRELNTDINRFITSADSAAKSLDNIINATTEITSALGMKLDPKITMAMDTAMKISKGIQVANAVAQGFSAGGFVGAMAAFSGGPATMALAAFGGGLGGNGPDRAVMAELAAIKQSLDEIKLMQQEILENQKRMMVMIKDLALIMEEYHREEMKALMDIHDEVLNAKEGLSEIDGEGFNSCKAMISYALNKTPNATYQLNVSNLEIIKSTINDVTSSNKSLKQFINSGSTASFKTCQHVLSTVFGTKDTFKFNRSAWIEHNGIAPRDGGKIVSKYYLPAFEYLDAITQNSKSARWQRLALHLPVLNVSTLMQKKSHYLGQPTSLEDLKNLTATHKLEQYISSLLILHPYLAIDHDVWNSSLNEVLRISIAEETHERTRQLLTNAFERVQIAIAQEALLAGEPLLPNLSQNWLEIMSEKYNCDKGHERFCFVRENTLMMSNLLTYVLIQRMGILQNGPEDVVARKEKYESLLASPELLAQLLMIPVERLVKKNETLYLVSKDQSELDIALPEIEVIARGQIQYTEAMARMIRLEHKVADELMKISPTAYKKAAQDKLAAVMFMK